MSVAMPGGCQGVLSSMASAAAPLLAIRQSAATVCGGHVDGPPGLGRTATRRRRQLRRVQLVRFRALAIGAAAAGLTAPGFVVVTPNPLVEDVRSLPLLSLSLPLEHLLALAEKARGGWGDGFAGAPLRSGETPGDHHEDVDKNNDEDEDEPSLLDVLFNAAVDAGEEDADELNPLDVVFDAAVEAGAARSWVLASALLEACACSAQAAGEAVECWVALGVFRTRMQGGELGAPERLRGEECPSEAAAFAG